ncbi:MAG: GbsR/MarR family transcriptional regulator [Casimicrobiaceae bacterium]|nr:GbsR/MarR family transcriptional regulator [Casimicrobiaceae bacterium]MCX8099368.1 GbsR/MarR family transcriptional regulator [Casimicrobiaceae bacterium]MDW8311972.1 GbsR/MarR family transcriptional regulator [Burkholderiales bacterium]
MKLTPLMSDFIAHFGEMGSRWGVNRTVGQIYALLNVAPQPLHADEIAETLGISRSNVSMSLKELESWNLLRVTRTPGDRRDYYRALDSVWEMFRAIAAERRRRELEPMLSMLRQALLEGSSNPEDAFALKRMTEMYELCEMASRWFDELQKLSPETLVKLMSLGSRIGKLVVLKERAGEWLAGSGAAKDDNPAHPPQRSETGTDG